MSRTDVQTNRRGKDILEPILITLLYFFILKKLRFSWKKLVFLETFAEKNTKETKEWSETIKRYERREQCNQIG